MINSVLKRSSPAPSIPPSLKVGNVVVEGVPSVQEAFTSFFANVGKTTASSVRSSLSQPDYKSYLGLPCLKSMVLNLYPTSDVEVSRIVNSLKGSSSSGPDCIPTMVVKFILSSIISPLTKLYLCRVFLAKFLKRPCLEAKSFFRDFQFGFRAKHSMEHACVTLSNFLHIALDSDLMSGVTLRCLELSLVFLKVLFLNRFCF